MWLEWLAMTEKREKSPKNDSSLEKKEVIKSETKNDTSFKFGKWKATCFIVLVNTKFSSKKVTSNYIIFMRKKIDYSSGLFGCS